MKRLRQLSSATAAALSTMTVLAITAAILAGGAIDARAQARGGAAPDEPTVTPFQLQRLFDSYALVQAQGFLRISDEQYAKLLPRFMALQDARRQALQQRMRVLNEVRRLLADPQTDEGQLKDRLKQLQDIESRGEAEAHKAYEAIDSVLDVRRQAQFRVFEEQMERRKLELVTRARQANRANNRPQ
jgi:hypothetical protein